MLQNFSDTEIEELLDIGWLYKDNIDENLIEKVPYTNLAGQYIGSKYEHSYVMKGTGERRNPRYSKLSDLLLCEHITFDDIRKNWRYHGILLDSPTFQAKLVKEQ